MARMAALLSLAMPQASDARMATLLSLAMPQASDGKNGCTAQLSNATGF